MLALDIETTGLDKNKNKITLVCTEDFITRKRCAYEFARVEANGTAEEYKQLQEKLIADISGAKSLTVFNANFDLPFIQVQFNVPAATVKSWFDKTSDILAHSKTRYKQTFPLQLLCEVNGIVGKSSTGTAAIKMAQEHKFDELLEYCQDDVRILVDLFRKQKLRHPRNLAVTMDLQDIVRKGLYEEWHAYESEEKQKQVPMIFADVPLVGSQHTVETTIQNEQKQPIELTTLNVWRLSYVFWKEHKAETGNNFYNVLCWMLDAKDANDNPLYVTSLDKFHMNLHYNVWNYSVWKDLPHLSYKEARQFFLRYDNRIQNDAFYNKHDTWVQIWMQAQEL